jgi:metal transporter CNNM
MEYVISLVLVGFSAIFSGLTLGLMGLDVHELRRKVELGDLNAKKVYAIRKNGNLLLTTLLLGNVAVNSVLAIFLGSIAPGVLASFLATALIFLFGEIIPQAVFSRYGLEFGARLVWLVRLLIFFFSPVCVPIAKVLDRVLGDELPTVYSRHELIKVIEDHEESEHSDIDADEERIVRGALSFSHKKVSDVMTPATVAVMIDINEPLTPEFVNMLRDSGHSRFPVYEEEDVNLVVGLLYLRSLIGRNLKGKVAGDFTKRSCQFIHGSSRLDDVFNRMVTTRLHLFMVRNEFRLIEGIVTLEDVLEEIVGLEIVDEFDKHENMREMAMNEDDFIDKLSSL